MASVVGSGRGHLSGCRRHEIGRRRSTAVASLSSRSRAQMTQGPMRSRQPRDLCYLGPKRATRGVSTSALPELAVELASSPYRDEVCAIAAAAGAYAWVKLFNLLAENSVLEQKLSRKVIHITSGPLFLMTWPLFSASPEARVVAGVVPTLQFIRLLAIGSGWWKDENAVKAVSREGGAEELLKGPLYYVAILLIASVVFWRDSALGVTAVSMMCAGDGMADIAGRRLKGPKLPFNEGKTIAGSTAMLLCGSAMSVGFILLFSSLGYFQTDPNTLVPAVLTVAAVSTLIEGLPVAERIDDNISVPLAAVLTGMALGL